jgi:hypothetical protein
MIVMEQPPELATHSVPTAGLVVEPSDITFEDLTPQFVRIRVQIRNDGDRLSDPTLLRLQSAPFGAFVSWLPLAVLPVPSLNPGESCVLTTDVPRSRPAALGNFDRLPPTTILTALNASPDESAPRPPAIAAVMLDLLRGTPSARPENRSPADGRPALPPDLWDLVGRAQPHWAGNINVFVGLKAVERHLSRPLRIHPGRPNLAMFVVGAPHKPDAYAFSTCGLTPAWRAALYDVTHAQSLVIDPAATPIAETQWIENAGPLMIMLAVRPPLDCQEGNVEIHVTRRSSQKTAVVEFNLNPASQGPGCYTV